MITPSRTTVHGSCSWSPDRIGRAVDGGHPGLVLDASGQFVAITETGRRTTIVTSRGGAALYFHALNCGFLHHGPTVDGVRRAAGLPWRWNLPALGDYLALDHVTGCDTLLAGVRRTAPGGVLTHDAGSDTLVETPLGPAAAPASTGDLRSWLEREVLETWRDDDQLCLTGGLDSRLLLAVLLKHGIRPRTLVCGQVGSADLDIASRLAHRYHLPIDRCEVTVEDFLDRPGELADRVGGTLPVSHWPGVLFARHATAARLVLGFNGEAVRDQHLPRRGAGAVRRLPARGGAAARLLSSRTGAGIPERTSCTLHPALADALSPEGWRDRLGRLAPHGGSLGDVAVDLFTGHRTPNKTGADLAALTAFTGASVPLCGAGWSAFARCRTERTGRGDRLHLRLIADLEPDLVHFPLEGRDGRRWRPGTTTRRAERHFFDQRHYHHPDLVGAIEGAVDHLDDLVDRPGLASDPAAARILFALATVGMWRANARRAGTKIEGSDHGLLPTAPRPAR